MAAAGKDGFNTRADNTMKTAKMHKEVLCKADGEYGRFYRRVEDYASQMHCIDNSRFAAKVRKNRQECVVLRNQADRCGLVSLERYSSKLNASSQRTQNQSEGGFLSFSFAEPPSSLFVLPIPIQTLLCLEYEVLAT